VHGDPQTASSGATSMMSSSSTRPSTLHPASSSSPSTLTWGTTPSFRMCYSFTHKLVPMPTINPSTLADSIPDPAGLQVFCVDCVSVSKFSVGLDINVTHLQLTHSYINITVQDFQHDIQLEFSLNDTAQYQKTLDVLLLAIPDLGISVRVADVIRWDVAHSFIFRSRMSPPLGSSMVRQ